MAPTQLELLANAQTVNEKIFGNRVKINKAVIEAGAETPVFGPPASELKLNLSYEDPFNGNQNNRRVAENALRSKKFIQPKAVNTVDVAQTQKDIDVSKKLDPDVQAPIKDQPAEVLTLPSKPTPGSPAAIKEAEEAHLKAAQAAQAVPKAGSSAPPPAGAGSHPPPAMPPTGSSIVPPAEAPKATPPVWTPKA
jgi:hypothetical protein